MLLYTTTGVPTGGLRVGQVLDAQVRPPARHRPADLPVGTAQLQRAGGGGGGAAGAGRPCLPALEGKGLPQPGARQRARLLRQVARKDAAGEGDFESYFFTKYVDICSIVLVLS